MRFPIPKLAPALAGLAALSGASLTAQQPLPDLAITSVTVVDVEAGTLRPGQTVVIREGRIAGIGGGGPPDGVIRVDGAGRYLMPGLWDMHVHLRHPAAPALLFPQFAAWGVTGVRDMAGDCEEPGEGQVCVSDIREWDRRVADGELPGPRVHAIASFPLNPPWDYEVTEEEARDLVAMLDERGVDLLKTYFRLTPEAFRWFAAEARERSLGVGGHLPLRMTAREASEAGLTSLEHARDFLFDCFPGSAAFRATARSQNPPMDIMRQMVEEHDTALCERTFDTFIENGTWYVPTHVTRRMDAFADDSTFRNDPRRRYLPAPLWDAWQADADRMVALDPSRQGRRTMRGFYEQGLAITGRAHERGVRIALGTDAGDTYVFPGSGAHDELGELVKAGLTPAQALAAATLRPAQMLGLDADYGTVETGKIADLLLLEANPLDDIAHTRRIDAVILAGRLLDRAELDRILSGVEAAARDF